MAVGKAPGTNTDGRKRLRFKDTSDYENIAEIGFVTMPFMGRESHFAAFFDKEGRCAYSFYVGREKHQLIESAKEQFLALQAEYK